MYFKNLPVMIHSLRQCVPVLHCLTSEKFFLMLQVISLTVVTQYLSVSEGHGETVISLWQTFLHILRLFWSCQSSLKYISPVLTLPSYVSFLKSLIIQDTLLWALFSNGDMSFFGYHAAYNTVLHFKPHW